jgi:zinc protease
VPLLRTILADYSQTSPKIMQFLAERYFGKGSPFRLAIIPEGQTLARGPASGPSQGTPQAGGR